jgi:hypothetical protein
VEKQRLKPFPDAPATRANNNDDVEEEPRSNACDDDDCGGGNSHLPHPNSHAETRFFAPSLGDTTEHINK